MNRLTASPAVAVSTCVSTTDNLSKTDAKRWSVVGGLRMVAAAVGVVGLFAGQMVLGQAGTTLPYANATGNSSLAAGLVAGTGGVTACTTVYKTTGNTSIGDGCAANAGSTVTAPYGLANDSYGNVFLADQGDFAVRVIYSSALGNTLATALAASTPGGGTNSSAAIAAGSFTSGNIYTAAGMGVATLLAAQSDTKYHCGWNTVNASALSAATAFDKYGNGCPATLGPVTPTGLTTDQYGNIVIGDNLSKSVRIVYRGGTLAACLIEAENAVAFGLTAGQSSCQGQSPTSVPQVGYIYAVAGTGAGGYSDQVIATSAAFQNLFGIGVDQYESIFVAEQTNQVLRMINGPNITNASFGPGFAHVIMCWKCTASTFGTATAGSNGTGTYSTAAAGDTAIGATGMGLKSPWGANVDGYGNVYVGDTGGTIPTDRVLALYNVYGASTGIRNPIGVTGTLTNGQVYTVIGNAAPTYTGGIASTSAYSQTPRGITFDKQGNMYVTDKSGASIQEVLERSGYIQVVASAKNVNAAAAAGAACNATTVTLTGEIMTDAIADGCAANQTKLSSPQGGIAWDNFGNMYVSSNLGPYVQKFSNPSSPFPATAVGSTSSAWVSFNFLAASQYVSNTGGNLFQGSEFTQDVSQTSTCVGGPFANGNPGSNCYVYVKFTPTAPGLRSGAVVLEGNGTSAGNAPSYVTGVAYLTATATGPVASFNPGILSTVATGFTTPAAVAVDASGNQYVADSGNHVINKITGGSVSTVAGTAATSGSGGDGAAATSATLNGPQGVAVAPDGTIYISDTLNHKIRRVEPFASFISTFAGTGTAGNTGDGGAAVSAQINTPYGIKLDGAGNVYFADSTANSIREIFYNGSSITTLVSGLNAPKGLAVDANGNVFIADTGNHQVKVYYVTGSVVGTLINTITGSVAVPNTVYALAGTAGSSGYAGDGSVANTTTTLLNTPTSIALDAAGDIYLAGSGNSRIRVINGVTGVISTIAGTGTAGTSTVAGDGGQSTATGAALGTMQGMAIDPSGSLFVTDQSANLIRKVSAGVQTFAFGNVAQGATSAAQSVNLTNIGTSNLNAVGAGVSVASGFTQGSAPITNCGPASANFPIASGASCGLKVTMTPAANATTGAVSASAVINDNSLNATTSQTITLTGTVIAGGATKLGFTAGPAATITYGANAGTVTVAEQNADGSTNASATDTITLTVTGPNSYSATYNVAAVAGVADFTSALSGVVLPASATQYVYTATFTGLTSATANETVNAKALTVVVDNQSKVYGSANPTLTGTVSGVVSGDGITATYATTADPTTGVGTVAITATVNDPNSKLANYSVTNTPGTLTITKAPLTVVVDNQSKVYGFANPTLTGTITGALDADGITANYTTTATTNTGVGTVAITATLVDPNSKVANYSVTNTPGTLTISKASLFVVVDDQGKTYGAANPTLTGTVTGVVSGDGITATYSTTAVTGSNAGSYPITATLVDPFSKLGNYLVTNTPGTLGVNRAVLNVVSQDPTGITYGQALPSYPITITGFVNGDTQAGTITGSAAVSTVPVTPVNAGSYTINVALGNLVATNGNYTFAFFSTGTLVISPAQLTVTSVGGSVTYGGTNPVYGYTMTGFVGSDTQANATTGAPTLTTTPATPVNAGSYTITAAAGNLVANNGNYTFTFVSTGALVINKASLTVTSTNVSAVYGAANPAYTYTMAGFVGSDTQANATTGLPSLTTTPATPVNAGSYTVTAGAGTLASTNYTFTFVSTGALTITKAVLTVTSQNSTMSYSGTLPTYTYTVSGEVNGDSAATAYSGTPTLTTSPATPVNAGNYPITVTAGTLSSSNYTFTLVSTGSLTINALTLTVTSQNASVAYGGTNPAYTYTMTGFASGDTQANATIGAPALTTTPATPVNAGVYPITAAAGTLAANNGNYTFTYVSTGALTISKVALTVTSTNVSATYGSANPAYTYTMTGFVGSDTQANATTGLPSLTTTPATPVNAGTYTVTAAAGTLASTNYTFTFVSTGALTISKASLTVTSTNVSTSYGSANPAYTYTITGFASGDTQANSTTGAPSLTTTPATPVNQGVYPVTVAAGTLASTNYTFTFVSSGSLSISPVLLTLTSNNVSTTYGSANPAYTYTVTGFVGSDTQANATTGAPTLTTSPATPVNAGTYTITVGAGNFNANNGNYTFTLVSTGALTIAKAALTVTSTNVSTTYGSANPAYTYTMTGFTGSDTQANATTGAPSLTTTPATPVNAGSYTVTAAAGTLASTNYSFTFVSTGALTISKASLTVTSTNVSATYGSANPAYTYTMTGFSGSDTQANSTSGAPSLTTSPATPVNAGTYAVTAAAGTLASTNYSFTFVSTGALTISKATLSVFSSNASATYGSANPTYTYTIGGFAAGDNQGNSTTGAPTLTTSPATPTAVGTYPITVTIGTLSATNYTFNLQSTGSLTISKATLTVTSTNVSTTFGSANPTYTYTMTGFTGSDTQANATTGAPTLTTTPATPVNAGSYTVTVTVGTLAATNYSFTFVSTGALTINKANQTITFPQPASPAILGSQATMTATSDSALPVTYGVTGPASVSGSTVTYGSFPSTVTITASQGGNGNYLAATNVQRQVTLTAATLAAYTVTGAPASYPNGSSQTVTVTARDSGGTRITGYSGTVTLSSSDPNATGMGPYTFASIENGVHTFTVTLNTGGTQSITATTGAISGSQTGIVVDDLIWLVHADGSLTKLTDAGTSAGSGTGSATGSAGGVAFDASGNIWTVGSGSNTLSESNKTGTNLAGSGFTGGGLNTPMGLQVDGAGNVWVVNGNGSVSLFKSNGTALTPSTGFTGGGLSSPTGVTVDISGNVWVSNGGNNSVTEFIGGGSPTTQLATGVSNGTTGARP